jgi:hypothetical protein
LDLLAVLPLRGPELLDTIDLPGYRYLHSARGELLRRLGRTVEAREEYRRAAALSDDDAERRLFERRLAAISQRASADLPPAPLSRGRPRPLTERT